MLTLLAGRRRALAAPGSASSCADRTAGGRSSATIELFQTDPHWRDHVLFYEYFHGDTGAGLGASHQTGWTALVAKLLEQSGSPWGRACRSQEPEVRADSARDAGAPAAGAAELGLVSIF